MPKLQKNQVRQILSKVYNPHKGQQAFHKARKDHQYRVMSNGRRWGKDYCAIMEGLQVNFMFPNSSIPIIGPTNEQIDEIFEMAQDIIPTILYGGEENVKLSKKHIHLINGSKFKFVSAEAKQSFRGLGRNVRMLIFTEAAYCKSKVWRDVAPSLIDNEAPAVFISTPNANNTRNWFYDLYLRGQETLTQTCPSCGGDGCEKCNNEGEIEKPNDMYNSKWWSYQGSSYENTKENGGYLKKEAVESIEEELSLESQEDVEREIYAKFTESRGSYFSHQGIEDCIYNSRPKILKPDEVESDDFYLAVDPARSIDYTGLVVMNDDLQVMFVEAFQDDWSIQYNKIKSRWERYGRRTRVLIDTTREENLAVALRDKGVKNIKQVQFNSKDNKGRKIKTKMYSHLRRLIQDREIELPPHEGLRKQLLKIHAKALSTGVRIEAREGHDDLVDALAMASWHASSQKKRGSGIDVTII